MKTALFATFAALVLPVGGISADESKAPSATESTREAFLAMEERMKITVLETYPAAGVPGTPLYEGIRLGIAWLDETQPAFFFDPSWPLKIAQAVQRSIASSDQVTAAPTPESPPRFPLRNDAKAKSAYRVGKTDVAQMEMIRRLTAQLEGGAAASSPPTRPGARLSIPAATANAVPPTDDVTKANALRTFPSAGIPGTPLHEGIRRGIAWLKENRPDYFKQRGWPELLAMAVHNTLDPLDRITPQLPPGEKIEYPAFEDPQALATHRRYKSDPEFAEAFKRLAAEVERQMAAAAQRPGPPQSIPTP